MTIRSASEEGASLQKQSSYSSLQGHADETNGTSPHSKSPYPYINDFDYSEGIVPPCTCLGEKGKYRGWVILGYFQIIFGMSALMDN